MNGVLDLLAQNLSGRQADQIAQRIGADPGQTQRAIGAALPAILTALNRNTNSTEGAKALDRALERDHDGSLLDNLGGFLSGGLGGKQADGGGVLGGQRRQVEQGVAQASGLDVGQVSKLLPLLAPVVMAALGRQKRRAGLDGGALSGLLGQEATRARQAAPSGVLGALGGFLDKDGDGSVGDDVAGQVGRAALGKLFGR
jgi:hypothetical protein